MPDIGTCECRRVHVSVLLIRINRIEPIGCLSLILLFHKLIIVRTVCYSEYKGSLEQPTWTLKEFQEISVFIVCEKCHLTVFFVVFAYF